MKPSVETEVKLALAEKTNRSPIDNDYELYFYVRPISRRDQACPVCRSRNYYGDGVSKDRLVSDISIGLKLPPLKQAMAGRQFKSVYLDHLLSRQSE